MKSLKIVFVFAMLMALINSISGTPSTKEELSLEDEKNVEEYENKDILISENQESTSLLVPSRFLAQKIPTRATMTCNKYPRVCHTKGSPGPDCCKKKCVNVKTDRLNCGMCGKKCKYSEICCKGKCVNFRSDKKNCGSCNNKCKKGALCVYGMCSYA